MRTINDDFAIRPVATPGGWTASAQYGSWIDMTKYRRALFVVINGELDADATIAAFEATDNAGAGAQALSGLTGTFTNGTHEGYVGLIEVLKEDMTLTYDFLTLRITTGATDTIAAIALLGDIATDYPALNRNNSTDKVAFNVGG